MQRVSPTLKNKYASTPWVLGASLIALLVCAPLFLILSEVLAPSSEGWSNIAERDPGGFLTSLGLEEEIPKHSRLYLRGKSTLIMLAGVGTLSTLIGVTLAWIVSMWQFPFRTTLSFLLVLPLAIPSYISATAYKLLCEDYKDDFLISIRDHYGGEVMKSVDEVWNYSFAIFVLSLCFYPYIYIAARTAFSSLSASYLESARTLGENSFSAFRKIAVPLARPAIIGGLMLVLLETLNEFGAMKIMGINTLTTEIFYAWINLEDKNAAVRIAGCMMLLVFFLLILELVLRGGKRFHAARSSSTELQGKHSSGIGTWFCVSTCLFFFSIAFLLPVFKLSKLAFLALPTVGISPYLSEIYSSVSLAGKAALVIMAISLFLSYTHRLAPSWFMQSVLKICNLGYAIPGAILGVTLITLSGTVNQSDLGHQFINFVFYGSTLGVIFAYAAKFLSAGLNPAEAGFKNIRTSLDEAASTLGKGKLYTFLKIHLPLLKYAISGGLLIVFVDLLKELPLTLIMNQETLATKTYSLFKVEERYIAGSIPALILILVGVSGMLTLRLMFRKLKN